MAQATVTLKVTPRELKVIDEALRMWAFAAGNLNAPGYDHPLQGYQFDLTMVNSSRIEATTVANRIRKDIGLD